ncbi:PP72 [Orf virus]|uniref:PP72 n=1 Tax=Orf virus TaxID=10258 RepID=F1AX69_ORFV|nr:PP72 [Orf virus]
MSSSGDCMRWTALDSGVLRVPTTRRVAPRRYTAVSSARSSTLSERRHRSSSGRFAATSVSSVVYVSVKIRWKLVLCSAVDRVTEKFASMARLTSPGTVPQEPLAKRSKKAASSTMRSSSAATKSSSSSTLSMSTSAKTRTTEQSSLSRSVLKRQHPGCRFM